jgi:hypothetical protein
MNPAPQARARPAGRRFDPKYTPFLVPAIMAIPTAILVAPSARRLAGHLTGTPHRAPPGNRH